LALKVYPLSARIPVKIGDVVFKLAPFSQSQKIELAEFSQFEGGAYLQNASLLVFRAMRYSIKSVTGLVDAITGEEYKLVFDEAGYLTEECANDLLNLEISDKMVLMCMAFLKGIPTELLDHRTGKPVEGVEILAAESGVKKNPSVETSPSSPSVS